MSVERFVFEPKTEKLPYSVISLWVHRDIGQNLAGKVAHELSRNWVQATVVPKLKNG